MLWCDRGKDKVAREIVLNSYAREVLIQLRLDVSFGPRYIVRFCFEMGQYVGMIDRYAAVGAYKGKVCCIDDKT